MAIVILRKPILDGSDAPVLIVSSGSNKHKSRRRETCR